jgi:hypothetical protein
LNDESQGVKLIKKRLSGLSLNSSSQSLLGNIERIGFLLSVSVVAPRPNGSLELTLIPFVDMFGLTAVSGMALLCGPFRPD